MANGTRTPEELNDSRFNYFIALKLGVKETNANNIHQAISRALGGTGGDLISRRLIELKADIENTMLNDTSLRQKEADAATAFKLNEAMTVLESMAIAKKLVYKSEVEDMANKANKSLQYFTVDDLEKAFTAWNHDGMVQYVDNTSKLINFSKFEKTHQLLSTPPASADLYEFIGVPHNANDAQIKAAKDAKYSEAMKMSDVKKKQLASGLCSDVDTILLKPDQKKQYDIYIALKDDVFDKWKLRKDMGAKELSMAEYQESVTTAMKKLGASLSQAQNILGEGIKFFLLSIAGGEADGSLELCPFCNALIKAGASVCPSCHKPIDVSCWNCSSPIRLTGKSAVCKKCSADYHNNASFNKACSNLDSILSSLNYNEADAQNAIIVLGSFGAPTVGSATTVIGKRIEAAKAEIEKRKNLEAQNHDAYMADLQAVNEEMAKKNFKRALMLGENLRKKFLAYNAQATQDVIDKIKAVLNQLNARLAQARAKLVSPATQNEGIKMAVDILDECRDFSEATAVLAKYPPQPSASIKASGTIDGKAIRVEWVPSTSDGVTYTLLRKIGSVPTTPTDGDILLEDSPLNFFDDSGINSGVSYYYAVYAIRGEVKSALTKLVAPAVVYQEVANLSQHLDTYDQIEVSFDLPTGATGVEVYASDSPNPPSNKNGARKVNASNKGFSDHPTCANCGYLIFVTYSQKGQTIYSRGLPVVFSVLTRLDPLRNVSFKQNSLTDFDFVCDKNSGTIKLLFGEEKLPFRYGSVMQKKEFSKLGGKLHFVSLNVDSAGNKSFMLPKGKVGFVYPYVENDQLFIISEPFAVNTIAGINNVNYEETDDGKFKISGELHENASHVLVRISHSHYVEDENDTDGETKMISASDFENNDGIILELEYNKEHYITIASEIVVGGKKTFSKFEKIDEVIVPQRRETVTVFFDYPKIPGKGFPLTIYFLCDNEITLPELELRLGKPRPTSTAKSEARGIIKPTALKQGGLFKKSGPAKAVVKINMSPIPLDYHFAVMVKNTKDRHLIIRCCDGKPA